MKEKYFDLMEKALSAYTDEHILRYFEDVKSKGLTEHGFPRLTSNIGILISHGRRLDLLPLFLQMMEFCTKSIPNIKAANDFSVREVVCAISEAERSGIFEKEVTERWRSYLNTIVPEQTYNCYATSQTDNKKNWALFTAVSEFFRQRAGLCDSTDFIELQVCQQLQWLDENGMYRDNSNSKNQQPMVYDIVPRGLFSLLLNAGYRGNFYTEIDENLRKTALLTLDMQSPTGELAFGGRSNQFLHNEAWLVTLFEFEAKRYFKEGNFALASRFKSASLRALKCIEKWLSKEPILHVKNRFPRETGYGCEKYTYFDKYMITVASFLYTAYLVCDDSIPFEVVEDTAPRVAKTTEHFHKLFLKSGGYGIELDLDADPTYDANGLGRVHHADAPAAICLSCPCPLKPNYRINTDTPFAFSLCSAVWGGEEWKLGAECGTDYEIIDTATDEKTASANLLCRFASGEEIKESYTVCEGGVEIRTRGQGKIGFALPALDFDGERTAEITEEKSSLEIAYEGFVCRYETNGEITNLYKTAQNRNGYYRAYLAAAEGELNIKITIQKQK